MFAIQLEYQTVGTTFGQGQRCEWYQAGEVDAPREQQLGWAYQLVGRQVHVRKLLRTAMDATDKVIGDTRRWELIENTFLPA